MLVGTSIFMSTLDSSIVNVALPFIMQDLKTDIQTIQWVVLSYLLTVSSLLLTFGRLSDIKGRRLLYLAGFSIFSAGSLCCGLSPTPLILILSRVIQGAGAAMLMACSQALIVDAFPLKERGKALGMNGAVVAAGLTTGPAIGGVILDYLSWPYIFFINIPIGLFAVIAGLMLLNDENTRTGSREPMDKAGSLMLMMALTGLILFLTHLPKWGFFSMGSVVCLAVWIVASIGFLINEQKTAYPLFDMALLKIRLFILPVASAGIQFACLFVIVFMMPFFLTYPCEFSASKTGLVMIVPFLFLLVVSPVSGMLHDRYGSRRLCMAGMGLMTASFAALFFVRPSGEIWSVMWRVAFAGIGTGLFVSPNNTTAMSNAPLKRRGIASGAVATARTVGMVIGVALAGLVFNSSFSMLTGGAALETYQSGMEAFFMSSFRKTIIMGIVLCLFGLCVTYARGRETLINSNN